MSLKRVSPEEAQRMMEDEGYVYLDVRSIPEFEAGHPKGAYNVPLLHMAAGGMQPNDRFMDEVRATFAKDAKIVVGCKAGGRSLQAAELMAREGFSDVIDQRAGFDGARDAFGRGGSCAENGGIANLNYRNQTTWNADWIGAHTWNAAATYVSGANSIKVGYQGAYHEDNRAPDGPTNDLTYRFNNGIPNQLTQRLEPYRTYSRVRYNALYVQDQLTRGRLTMTGALRYDHSWSYYPEQSIGGPGARFLPVQFTWPG